MSRIVTEVLQRMVFSDAWDRSELAEAASCSRSTIDNAINHDADIGYRKIQDISLAMCRRADTSMARCFLTPDYEIVKREPARSNGVLDDEALDLGDSWGEAIQAYKAGNRLAFDKAIQDMRSVIARCEAEGERL